MLTELLQNPVDLLTGVFVGAFAVNLVIDSLESRNPVYLLLATGFVGVASVNNPSGTFILGLGTGAVTTLPIRYVASRTGVISPGGWVPESSRP